MNSLLLPILSLATLFCLVPSLSAATVRVYPAPADEVLSKTFTVEVDGKSAPVYVAKVASAEPALRWKAMDDKAHSAEFFQQTAFCMFDMDAPVVVKVTHADEIRSFKVLPSSYRIVPKAEGKTLTFVLSEPKPVTIEVNGDWVNALHVFANPFEHDTPRPGDPNVIYFGPGVHEISHLVVTNNQTVYIAGGAVVRGVISPDEPYQISSYSGLRTYSPTLVLRGDNIRLRGRGIIDGSRCTTHAKNLVHVEGRDIQLEGVVLRDSSTWTIPIRKSERVIVENLKLLGYRANSDGVDICNSRDVTVRNCFIRTLDDLVVIKTDKGQGPTQRIHVHDCVLWNEVAHALSVGAELRENVDDVRFENCDVIHDKGREWTLRVYHCDSARISNIRFENLRIEESPRLISLWIDKAFWTRDPERGHIEGVTFKNITATASPLRIELKGFDTAHAIENVSFEKVIVNGRALAPGDLKTNEFVRRVQIR